MNSAVPTTVFIRLREQCNARCQMCSFWETPDGPGLSPEQVLTLLEELVDIGVREVAFTGGEPFYYSGFDKLLAAVGLLSRPPTVAVITNGSRRDEFACRALRSPALKRVHVSLDALTDEGMLSVRGRPGWYTGILAFVRLVRRENPEVQVVGNVILNRHNAKCLEGYFAADFDQVNFLNLKGTGFEMALDAREEAQATNFLRDLLERRPELRPRIYVPLGGEFPTLDGARATHVWGREAWPVPCRLASRMAYIDQRGDLFPCNCLCHDRRSQSLGNVLVRGFRAVWDGGPATGFREHCRFSPEWTTCPSCDPANRLYNLGLLRPELSAGGQREW